MPRLLKERAAAGVTAYGVVRIVLAMVLLAAAALKGYQLAAGPVLGRGILESRWFLIVVVELELLFGLWLLAGLHPTWTRRASMVCFACFACVSAIKAFHGEASCGCFGPLPVPPRYTFLLDLGAVLALALCRPVQGSPQRARGAARPAFRLGVSPVFALWATVGLPCALAMANVRDTGYVHEAGLVSADGRLVVLLPAAWEGQRFPLIEHIDIGERLAEGNWVVVLYRHDCPHCQESLPKYEATAEEFAASPDGARVALVESPPYGDPSEWSCSHCLHGRLSAAKDWFFSAPLELLLRNGAVVRVGEHMHARGSGYTMKRRELRHWGQAP